MARFCGKCGAPIDDNATFCGNCGNQISQSPIVNHFSTTVTDKSYGSAWLTILLQIICPILFFLPTIKVGAFGIEQSYSILDQVTDAGYSAIHIILLILFFGAVIFMALPLIQKKPVQKLHITIMSVMTVLFFVANIITYFVIGNAVKKRGYGIVDYHLTAWGWFYIIVSILAVIRIVWMMKRIRSSN